jgi:DNA polymerase-3 subunit alpha (Gram-positive type)
MPQKKFTEALSLYHPADAEIRKLISSAQVANMALNRESRALSLTVFFQDILSCELLSKIKDGIKSAYQLSSVEIFPKYPKELFNISCLKELTEIVCENIPAAAPFLNGCDFDRQANEIHIKLAGGGAYILEQLKCAEEYKKLLSEYFSITETKILFDEANAENYVDKLDEYAKQLLASASDASNGQRETPAAAPKKAENAAPFKRPRSRREPEAGVKQEDILLGGTFADEIIPMEQINSDFGRVAVCGEVFSIETRETYSKKQLIVSADITDKTGSIRVKKIFDTEKAKDLLKKLTVGAYIKVRGDMEYDKYYGDYTLKPIDMYLVGHPSRSDNAAVKRVELHLHTNMSQMDAVSSPASLVKRAIEWGHGAIAITDHGVTQGFPEAMKAANGIKIIYGVEGYFINDLADITVVRGNGDGPLDGEFVCFDIETTGTDPAYEGITQIAACIVSNGEIKDTFNTYTNPGKPISPYISELTGITDDMVKNAPSQREGVEKFKEFCGGRILVAHNASFDTGFISSVCAKHNISWEFTSIDTLEMSRVLMPELSRHKLNIVAEALKLPQFRHHSAIDDAKTLAMIFINFIRRMAEHNITKVSEMNDRLSDIRRENYEKGSGNLSLPVRHIILLAKNRTGIVNLYRLVSFAHIKYMNRRKQPVIPKHELEKYREGLIVGSACESGELYSAVVEGKPWQKLKKIAKFYDYLEIQSLGNNEFLIRDGVKISKEESVRFTREDLISFNKTIVKLGDELRIPVVATGDVHFLDYEDRQYRAILMAAEGFKDADFQPPLYFRTTDEMLEEFSYLGSKKAYEVVVKNSNLIADMCENIKPFPDGLFPPELPGSADELRNLTWSRAKEMYGDPLPEIVEKAILQELDPIIAHGYDVMYMLAQKLIARSLENGYLVGSRGSVGSSIVAFFAGITEINALPPHYRCKKCKYSEFHPECDLGPDMEDKLCPVCGEMLIKDGFDIPFATFLGFNADKDPDIDLNFSSDYQAMAHRHTMELFGEDKVFKAGTITTVAEATAYGYVKKYNEERGRKVSRTEESRLALGCTGVKRTTGQHPGGLVVVPKNKEIYEFCPIQRPAGKTDTDIITTHIDYHSIKSNLLKFDLLGKDDPTVLRYLEDNTGIKLEDIPLDDKQTLEIFSSIEPLGIEGDEITGFNGSLGIPEFGTSFVRGMLNDTQPETIADLIRISGLSHGEGVWLDNAEKIIKEKGVELKDCICCRDDIMNYLIKKGIEPKLAFTIMEVVRKPKEPGAKKLKPEWEELMRDAGIPDWYIDSCNKITYLFPKAHAAAYVVMALRIAWFKVHHPLAYYGSFFSIKAVQLDADIMLAGNNKIVEKIKQINELGNKASATEKELRRTLEIAHEYLLRGFKFLPVDIYESEPVYFKICREQNALRLPFRAIPGLGDVAAPEIVAERSIRPFASIEDLAYRCRKLSATVIEDLKAHGALHGIPDSSQTVLFNL